MAKSDFKVQVLGKTGISYFLSGDCVYVNLDKLVLRESINKQKWTTAFDNILKLSNKINLYNWVTVVNKLDMLYSSEEAFGLAELFITFLRKTYPFIDFRQNGTRFDGCIDMRPLDKVITVDGDARVIYLHKSVQNVLNLLGFQSSQVNNLLRLSRDFKEFIPPDMLANIPIENPKSLVMYNRIKDKLLQC